MAPPHPTENPCSTENRPPSTRHPKPPARDPRASAPQIAGRAPAARQPRASRAPAARQPHDSCAPAARQPHTGCAPSSQFPRPNARERPRPWTRHARPRTGRFGRIIRTRPVDRSEHNHQDRVHQIRFAAPRCGNDRRGGHAARRSLERRWVCGRGVGACALWRGACCLNAAGALPRGARRPGQELPNARFVMVRRRTPMSYRPSRSPVVEQCVPGILPRRMAPVFHGVTACKPLSRSLRKPLRQPLRQPLHDLRCGCIRRSPPH